MNKLYPLFFFLLFLACHSSPESQLFHLLDANNTGIDFSNDLEGSDSLILLSFEYLYNGGGVAIGDFNNDQLPDIFFPGNKVASRLYLNQGELKFEDITVGSGVDTKGKWASGAAVVDINQDGWQDIYVCVGGFSKDKKKRSNLLYINQKNNTFLEQAAAYGLDDSGYSINAAFFDYDRDGDLDLYLLTTELDPYNWREFRPRRILGEAPNNDRFYRNNGNETFTNVTNEAGITFEGYGLGIAVCDINEDDWPDLYIANDFFSSDLIYINNQDGTFSNKIDDYLSHTSRNSMGTDLQDFNNDGLVDIMVLDMLPTNNQRQKSMFGFFNYDKYQLGLKEGYHPQFPRNTLQKNNGNGTFSEIGQLAGVHQTDWSWSALFADFDNDGWQDLFVTNGYRQDLTNMDFATYSRQVTASPIGTDKAKEAKMFKKLQELPEIKIHNFIFQNTESLVFKDQSKEWGFTSPSYSNGCAYVDLDLDGDLDLLISNIDEKASLYENRLNLESKEKRPNYLRIDLKGNPGNTAGIGSKITLTSKGQSQHRFVSPYRGYLSSVDPILHFGLGKSTLVEEIKIKWPDGKTQILKDVPSNQVLLLEQKNAEDRPTKVVDAKPKYLREVSKSLQVDFVHQEKDFADFKVQPILPHKHSQNGPGIAVGDINGDQLEDFFVGGSAGFPAYFFLQKESGEFTKVKVSFDSTYTDMGALLFDADSDGDLDLYVVSGGSRFSTNSKYQDRLYLNDGTGTFTKTQEAIPTMTASGSSVIAGDYDQDGDLDLLVTGRIVPGAYPMPAKTYLLRNDSKEGNCIFKDVSKDYLPQEGQLGLVSSGLFTDFDNDNQLDLLLVGEWMPLTFLKNTGTQFVELAPSSSGVNNSSGWWNSIAGADFDKDGDIDYVIGNRGLNSFYQGSPKEPLQVYAKDFDKNGRIDPVMAHYINGKNHLAPSRDMLIEQINSMKGRFKTYKSYGDATFDRSFTKEEIKDAYVLKGNNFSSSYLENLGNGQFSLRALPQEAQIAPIFGIQTCDVNQDGHLDLLLVGNSYASEVMLGPYDACKGLTLLGDGNGAFSVLDIRKSGFFSDLDTKAMARITIGKNQDHFLVSRNRSSLQIFSSNSNKMTTSQVLKKEDQYAIIQMPDGQSYKEEFYHGSAYLSQSSRNVNFPRDAEKISIFDSQGKQRIINH